MAPGKACGRLSLVLQGAMSHAAFPLQVAALGAPRRDTPQPCVPEPWWSLGRGDWTGVPRWEWVRF